MIDRRAYAEVQVLIREVGGSMAFHPGSAPGAPGGGDWVVTLRGREARVGVHDRNLNDLDQLYLLKPGRKPVRWDEHDAWVEPARLVDDAFWILVTRLPWRPVP